MGMRRRSDERTSDGRTRSSEVCAENDGGVGDDDEHRQNCKLVIVDCDHFVVCIELREQVGRVGMPAEQRGPGDDERADEDAVDEVALAQHQHHRPDAQRKDREPAPRRRLRPMHTRKASGFRV